MSLEHDLNQDPASENLPQESKPKQQPDSSKPRHRYGNQPQQSFCFYSKFRRTGPTSERLQQQPYQSYHQRQSNGNRPPAGRRPPPGFSPTRHSQQQQQYQRPFVDPGLREQRRLFYQAHYRRLSAESDKRSGQYRPFRGRYFRTSDNKTHTDFRKKKTPPDGNGDQQQNDQPVTDQKEKVAGPVVCESDVKTGEDVNVTSTDPSDDRKVKHSNGSRSFIDRRVGDNRHRDFRNKKVEHKKKTDDSTEGQKAEERKRQEVEEVAAIHSELQAESSADSEDEPKDCPLCLEPLDPTECNLYPCCFCKFQICLFCLNRLKEEEQSDSQPPPDQMDSQKRSCGSCPACRNPYPADSDDESMAVAVRTTKERAKANSEKQSGKGNKSSSSGVTSKSDPLVTGSESQNRAASNLRIVSREQVLTTAKRSPRDGHHKQQLQQQQTALHHRHEKVNNNRTNAYRSEKREKRSAAHSTVTSETRNNNSSRSSSSSHRPGPRDSHTIAVQRRVQRHNSNQTERKSGEVKDVKSSGREAVPESKIVSCDHKPSDDAHEQQQDAASIKAESSEEKKQELVSLLSSLGLSPCNIRFHPQRQES